MENHLGADDKAGNVRASPFNGTKNSRNLFLHIGEEVGCIGSKAAASKDKKFYSDFDRIISFDRKDVCSIITHQSWKDVA
jgi:hypothetical protein